MATRGKGDSVGLARRVDGLVPTWVCILVSGVGLVLIAIAVWSYLGGRSDGVLPMLLIGAFLLVGGPLMNRLISFKFGLTGAEATLAGFAAANEIASAETQVAEGHAREVEGSANVPVRKSVRESVRRETTAEEDEVTVVLGESLDEEVEEEVVVTRVVLADGCSRAIERLSDEDTAAVQAAIEEMKSLKNPGGVQLPGSSSYWVREVNDHIRLVYRPLNRLRETDPQGYVILNVVRPGSTLWKLTDYAR
jgi:hypothetical protein